MSLIWQILLFVVVIIMMTVCLLLIRAVKRRTQYIYILVMDKTRHSPLPNHAVLGFFNKTMYQQQFLRPIAGQQQYVFAHQSTQQSKTIGQTDANGFFKLRNRWRPLYAIGVQLGQKETVLLLHHFAAAGKGFPTQPRVVWV